jgi:hypothetical protein
VKTHAAVAKPHSKSAGKASLDMMMNFEVQDMFEQNGAVLQQGWVF